MRDRKGAEVNSVQPLVAILGRSSYQPSGQQCTYYGAMTDHEG